MKIIFCFCCLTIIECHHAAIHNSVFSVLIWGTMVRSIRFVGRKFIITSFLFPPLLYKRKWLLASFSIYLIPIPLQRDGVTVNLWNFKIWLFDLTPFHQSKCERRIFETTVPIYQFLERICFRFYDEDRNGIFLRSSRKWV